MKQDTDFQDPNRGHFAALYEKLEEVKNDLIAEEVKLHHARTIAACQAIPEFQGMRANLAKLSENVVKSLTKRELSPYEQGIKHGFLRGMGVFVNADPLDTAAIAEIERVRIPALTEEIAHLKDMLGIGA